MMSPLLFPTFGIPDIVQGFIRKAAVLGHCTTMLHTNVTLEKEGPDGIQLGFDNDTFWQTEKIYRPIDSYETLCSYEIVFDPSFNPDFSLSVTPAFVAIPPSVTKLSAPIYLLILNGNFFNDSAHSRAFIYSLTDFSLEDILKLSHLTNFLLVASSKQCPQRLWDLNYFSDVLTM
jgi:hypothetical protein